MTTYTIESIQEKLAEAQATLDQIKAVLVRQDEAAPVTVVIPGVHIALQPGEHYAGPVLDSDGQVTHHLVQMSAQPSMALTWQEAKRWANAVGGDLPTRQEQALLFANCRPHLKPSWHWSSEVYEGDASFAWGCYFDYGDQHYARQIGKGSAVAVRRLTA